MAYQPTNLHAQDRLTFIQLHSNHILRLTSGSSRMERRWKSSIFSTTAIYLISIIISMLYSPLIHMTCYHQS